MDLQEQRLQCLRMAIELGGKPEAVISAANDLMNFVATGATPAAKTEAIAAADRIAACGTVLEMPESGDLAAAEPAPSEPAAGAPAANDAEPLAAGVEASPSAEPSAEPLSMTVIEPAAPAETADEEAARVEAAPSEVEATEIAATPSAAPVEQLPEVAHGGSEAATESAHVG